MYSYTVYAYFNQEQLYALFNGVVMIMGGGGDYLMLMKSLALVGLIASGVAALAKARAENFASYFIMTALLFGTLVVPKATITIVDANGGNAPKVVANVPWGLGAMASITSHIGYWMTAAYETSFSVPDNLSFQKNGFLFGAKLLTARQNVQSQDPQLRSDMLSWFKDCLAYEIIDNPARLDAIRTSTNLWTTVGPYMNPGRVVSIYQTAIGQVSYIDCRSAYQELGDRLTADETQNIVPNMQKYLFGNNTADVKTAISQADDAMLHATSTGAADVIRQAVMLNLFRDGPASIASVTNNPTMAAIEIAKVQAAHQANSSYEVMRSISESALPLVRNAIHTIIIAVFPIVLLLIIMSGDKGPGIFIVYVSLLFFVELWAPLFAVVSHLLTYASMRDVSKLIDGGGINLSNYEVVSKGLISAQGVAGMLTMSIPLIAYSLVSRSQNAVANLSSNVTSPSQSSASSAGAAAAMGNMPEWGNMTMYQQNSAPSFRHGSSTDMAVGSDGSRITTYGDGGQSLDRSTTQSNLGAWTAGLGTQSQSALQRSSQDASASAAKHAMQAADNFSAGLSSAKEYTSSFTQGNGIQTTTGLSQSSNVSKAIGGIEQAQQEIAKTSGLSQSMSAKITSLVAAGASLAVVKAGLSQEGATGSQLEAGMRAAEKLSNSQQFKNDVSQVTGFGTRVDTTNGSDQQTRAATGMKSSFEHAKSESESASQELSRSKSYSEAASHIESGGASVQESLANAWIASKGGAEAANDFIKSHSNIEIGKDLQEFAGSEMAARAALGNSNFQDQSTKNQSLQSSAGGMVLPSTNQDIHSASNEAIAGIKEQDRADRSQIGGNAHSTPTTHVPGENGQSPITVTSKALEHNVSAAAGDAGMKISQDGRTLQSQNHEHRQDATEQINHAANTPGALTAMSAENAVGKGSIPGGAVKTVAESIPTATPEQAKIINRGGDYSKVPKNPDLGDEDLSGG